MNQNVLSQVLEFLRRKMWSRRWQRAVTCLAAVAVFGVTYALVLPAITMTNVHPTLSAEQLSAWSGDELAVKVTAEAEEEGPAQTFALKAEGEGADLSASYVFNEEGICVITDEEGKEIELHRSVREGKENVVDYWFTLESGTKTAFTLNLIDEVDETRFAELVQVVQQDNEEETEETASASDAGRSETSAAAAKNATENRATASDAVKASGSNADVKEANSLSKTEEEKIVTEKEDDGFEQILDGAVVNDLEQEDEAGEKTETVASLKLSAGIGKDYKGALKDAEKNADKRGDSELKFTWKDVVAAEGGEGGYLSAYVNGANIAVFYDEDAEIPGGAVLSVTEIEEGTEEYERYFAQSSSVMEKATGSDGAKTVSQARFFDITILDENGSEIEPAAAVKVVITYDEAPVLNEDTDLHVLHFKEDEPEVVKPGTLENENTLEGLSFTTDSFSVYGIVGMEVITVRYLSSDGNTYEVTVTYGRDAEIPVGATLQVTEYAKNSEQYKQAYDLVVGKSVTYTVTDFADEDPYTIENSYFEGPVPDCVGFSALDISILDRMGQKIEPKAPVTVRIEVKDVGTALNDEAAKKDISKLDVTVHHLKEENGTVNAELVADTQGKVPGAVKVNGQEAPVAAEFSVGSFSIFSFRYDNGDPELTPTVRTYTVHYGYLDGDNVFHEFPDGTPSMAPHQYHEGDASDPNEIDYTSDSTSNHRRQYLIYDVEDYVYQNAYYSDTETDKPASAQRIYPHLYKSKNMCYYPYASDGAEDNGKAIKDKSHVYMIYKGYPATEGGSTDQQIDDKQDQVQEPEHSKELADNGDGTYTLSLKVKGAEIPSDFQTKADVIIILDRSGSMKSNKVGDKTRWEIAKSAITSLAGMLESMNTAENPELVRMSLVSFAYNANINCQFTTSASTLTTAMNKLSASGSTNWEFPLILANSMPVREDAETYVIFFSDGTPNLYVSRGDNVTDDMIFKNTDLLYHQKNSHKVYNQYGIWGTGSDSGNPELIKLARDKASATGKRIVGKGKHLYAIGGFGADNSNVVKYMKTFITDSYEGVEFDDGKDAVSEYYLSANDESSLLTAFEHIVNKMQLTFGQINVNMNDGVTDMTDLEAKRNIPGLENAGDFKYYREGGELYPTKTEWTDIPDKNKATYDKATGSIIWDLEGVGLSDGVTYSLEVIVWPNQASYDLLQGLNNGDLDWDDPDDVTPAQKSQIVRTPAEGGGFTYSLKTNVDDPAPSLTYSTCTFKNGEAVNISDPITGTPFENPDPVPLTGTKMKVVKKWEDSLSDSDRPQKVTVEVYEDQTNPKKLATFDLSAPDWTSPDFYISPGLVIQNDNTGGNEILLNTGHDYWVKEITGDYHYEFATEILHPELFNSNKDIRYTYKGEESVNDDKLTGINRLKGGININKTIVHTPSEAEPEETVSDATRTFTIKGTLKKGDQALITDDDYCKGLGWRIFEGDDFEHPIDRGDITSEEITCTIKDTQTFRIVNIPAGATWEFAEDESDLGDRYSWESIEANYIIGSDGEEIEIPVSGKNASDIVRPNAATNVIVTNRRIEYNLNVLKTDETGEASRKLKGATFQLYSDEKCETIAKDVNGDDCKPVTTGEDGIAKIGALGVGTYYLKETKSPNGFILLTDPIEITVDKTNGVTYKQKEYAASESGESRTYDPETNTWTITVINNPGKELPHTGGPGTTLYTLSGLMLLIASALLYGFRRRHEERRAA